MNDVCSMSCDAAALRGTSTNGESSMLSVDEGGVSGGGGGGGELSVGAVGCGAVVSLSGNTGHGNVSSGSTRYAENTCGKCDNVDTTCANND